MSGKQTLAPTGEGASTSASTSKKRRKRNESNTDDALDVAKQDEQNEQNEQNEQQKKRGLPDEVWAKILEDVDDNSVMAFACVNKQLRRVQQESGRELATELLFDRYSVD